MAIPFVKLSIIVGAGVAGTILAKDTELSVIPSFLSGAFKIFKKHLQDDKTSPPSRKTGSDNLMTQVNSLRQQLQNLQASGPVTIITKSRSGRGTYSITVVVVAGVAGYIYIWWKGWKLSDMMFVTKRNFTTACNNVATQLDAVSSSVKSTKKHLSSRIDRIDCSLEDCLEVVSSTKGEVSELNGEITGFHVEVASVHRAVQNLESKLVQIEGSQDVTTRGVYHLCKIARDLESKKPGKAQVLGSSSVKPALEHPQVAPINRLGSLPPKASTSEPTSPSTPVEVPRVLQSSRSATVASLKEVQGLTTITRTFSTKSNPTEPSNSRPSSSNTPAVGNPSITRSSSNSLRYGWRLPTLGIFNRSSGDAS